MKFVLVWFLVSTGYGSQHHIEYSPPLQTLEDCKRLQEFAYIKSKTQCIQVSTLIK